MRSRGMAFHRIERATLGALVALALTGCAATSVRGEAGPALEDRALEEGALEEGALEEGALEDRPDGDRANGARVPLVPVPPAAITVSSGGEAPSVSLSEPKQEATEPTSEPLACGVHNPMPGGLAAGYAADTGLDLVGPPSPVYALAAGEVDYAEAGHSLWSGPHDTDLAVRLALDEPIDLGDGREVTHVWYAHLSALAFEQPSGAAKRRHVRAGERLGVSGRARGVNHLHLGLLLDGQTSQAWGTFLLEDEVRRVLCKLPSKHRLPKLTRAAARTRSASG